MIPTEPPTPDRSIVPAKALGLDPDKEDVVDGIWDRIGPLEGRNRVASAFYDGPGWARFRPWERLFLGLQGGARRARRQILRHLDPLGPGARVLEVGIGDGENLRFLPSTWTVFGADLARNPLLGCIRRSPAMSGRLAWAEAESLPFADATFDACYSVGGFNYYRDHAQSLAEMARVTRPGGLLVVADELPHLKRFGIGHLIGRPKLDGVWLRALGLDLEFAAMVLDFAEDPEEAVVQSWPGAVRHSIWTGLGYCYSATRPDRPGPTPTHPSTLGDLVDDGAPFDRP